MVVLEKTAYGVTILHGRTEEEWLVAPWVAMQRRGHPHDCSAQAAPRMG
jgi:hypothetical protein